jgi:predicted acyl esterase
MGRVRWGFVAAAALLCGAVACERLPDGAVRAGWTVRPGVEQVTVTGALPGQPLTLYEADAEGRPARERLTLLADEFGQAHFSYLPADPITVQSGPDLDIGELGDLGDGGVVEPGRYVVRDDRADTYQGTAAFEVLGRDDVPGTALYDRQALRTLQPDILGNPKAGHTVDEGFNYLEVRDGVRLSAMVRLPDDALYGPGPYPTVIEYSGYGPSNPNGEEPSSRLARSLGYATVDVNMRGTGCSGGVFDVFNPAQMADGYDIVEIVARQPWVLHHEVGMVGLSYSGISQLYVAATRPPHLAAITPQSVIADPWLEQYPGGIYNSGFTKQWLAERDRQSAPGGASWVRDRIEGGDTTCADHQVLRNQNPDFESFTRALTTYHPLAAERDLRRLVRDVTAPVFLTGAFQDEQTGPQFTTMIDEFDQTEQLRVGLWNGRHPDGLGPANVMRWYEFLELHVARRVPHMHPIVRAVAPAVLAEVFGLDDVDLGPERLHDRFGTDYAAAQAAYDAEPAVRVIYESGRGANELGEPGGTFEQAFPTWPPPQAQPTTWYLGGDEALRSTPPTASSGSGVDAFRFDPAAGQARLFPDGDYPLFDPLWSGARWSQYAPGDVLSYLTPPLTEPLVVSGPGYARLYVASDGTDANVQVTVSEVRPDGIEYELQNGWLRVGHRAVDPSRSNALEITHFFSEQEYVPLTPGRFEEAKVEIPSFAHVFRTGSRIRLTIATPGRNHATWAFDNPTYGGGDRPAQRVAHTAERPSFLLLPVLPGVDTPDLGPAPCPSLRGMACRPYEPRENTAVG